MLLHNASPIIVKLKAAACAKLRVSMTTAESSGWDEFASVLRMGEMWKRFLSINELA